jgi:nucleotide-binding universal stress UspA family protein
MNSKDSSEVIAMPVLSVPTAVSVEKILIATDFSASSDRALAYAKALALRFGSMLEVAHIFDPAVVTSWEAVELEISPEDRLQMSEQRLGDLERKLLGAGIVTHTMCRGAHRPAAALLQIAKEENVDMIVAGTSSKTGIERVILGSTAEQLIRSAECPVLTVGPHARMPQAGPLTFRTIVFANDFSPEATKAAVFALSFAADSGAKLYSCFALEDESQYNNSYKALDDSFRKALEARIPVSSYDWCEPICVVEHGSAPKAILDLAKRVRADLIVLGARKSTFWLTRVERGLTPALLAESTCPVMTVC